MKMKMNKKWNIFISILLISIFVIIGLDIKKRVEPQIKTVVIEESVIPNEYLGEFTVTHYSYTGNRCSTGVYPKAGRTIAVDPKIIPYGTYLYVEGYGVRLCEDCGSAIRGNKLDMFVNSHSEAIKLGKKTVKVWKLTNP